MLEILKKNRFFIIPYLVFIFISSLFLLFYTKSEIHIYINQFHNSFSDFFFKYITYLGDGMSVAIFIVILLFVRFRYFLIMLVNVFLTTVVVQTLKRIVFEGSMRPSKYFSGLYELHLVDGVKMHHFNSFPSGHTATAFALFFMAALISKNNYLKLIFFTFAFLAAFSRVYLSQHFLVDIYTGSIISMIITFILFYWGLKWKNPKLDGSVLRKN